MTGRSCGRSPRALLAPTSRPPRTPPPASSGAVAVLPVIAARLVVHLRRTPKFAHGDHQRRIQQPALVQVGEQGGQGLVQPGGMPILHDLEVPVVMIPAAVAGIFLRLDVIAPVDLNERNAALDQPSRQQTRLAETRSAIAVDGRRLLLADVEDLDGVRRREERERQGSGNRRSPSTSGGVRCAAAACQRLR